MGATIFIAASGYRGCAPSCPTDGGAFVNSGGKVQINVQELLQIQLPRINRVGVKVRRWQLALRLRLGSGVVGLTKSWLGVELLSSKPQIRYHILPLTLNVSECVI